MNLVVLCLFGGVVALDGVSALQSMVSRPLPVGVLAGLILGDVATGAQVGVILELFLLVAVPAGGGRMPEGGMATLVATTAAVAGAGSGGLALGVAGGLLWGEVAGWTQSRLRVWNGRHVPVPGAAPVMPEALGRSVGLGLLADGVRGVAVTAVGVTTALALTPYLAGFWWLDAPATYALVLLGGLASVGVVFRGRGMTRRASLLFAAGIVTGLLAGVGAP